MENMRRISSSLIVLITIFGLLFSCKNSPGRGSGGGGSDRPSAALQARFDAAKASLKIVDKKFKTPVDLMNLRRDIQMGSGIVDFTNMVKFKWDSSNKGFLNPKNYSATITRMHTSSSTKLKLFAELSSAKHAENGKDTISFDIEIPDLPLAVSNKAHEEAILENEVTTTVLENLIGNYTDSDPIEKKQIAASQFMDIGKIEVKKSFILKTKVNFTELPVIWKLRGDLHGNIDEAHKKILSIEKIPGKNDEVLCKIMENTDASFSETTVQLWIDFYGEDFSAQVTKSMKVKILPNL